MRPYTYRAVVRQFDATTGNALCIIPQLYATLPKIIAPFLSEDSRAADISPLQPGDSIMVVSLGGDDDEMVWIPTMGYLAQRPGFDLVNSTATIAIASGNNVFPFGTGTGMIFRRNVGGYTWNANGVIVPAGLGGEYQVDFQGYVAATFGSTELLTAIGRLGGPSLTVQSSYGQAGQTYIANDRFRISTFGFFAAGDLIRPIVFLSSGATFTYYAGDFLTTELPLFRARRLSG